MNPEENLETTRSEKAKVAPNLFVRMSFRDTRPDIQRSVRASIRRSRVGKSDASIAFPPNLHVRILSVRADEVEYIDIEDPNAKKKTISRSTAEALIETRAWIFCTKEPMAVLRAPRLTDKQEACMKRNAALIAPFIALGEEVLDEEKCARCYREVRVSSKKRQLEIERRVRRYLQGGMAQQALAGKWGASTAEENRVDVDGIMVRIKPSGAGRPRSDGFASFKRGPLDTHKIVRGGIDFFEGGLGNNLTVAWHKTLARDFVDVDLNSPISIDVQLEKFSPSDFPSSKTFKRIVKRAHRAILRWIRKKGPRDFNLNGRMLNSTTAQKVPGPGYRFQIDPTPYDIQCVHRITRRPIGKIILYLVVDVFSHMIVGLHVHVGNAGFDPASLAILSCALNKVELYAKYGIKISPETFPSQNLPAHITADSELSSLRALGMVDNGGPGVTIEPSYRAELKGLVEALLGAASKLAESLPGHSKGPRKRAAQPVEAMAVLDHHQIMEIVMLWVLEQNVRVLRKYSLTDDMLASGLIDPCPLDLWVWGIENRMGAFKHLGEEDVFMKCLPRGKAQFTRSGLERKGETSEAARAFKSVYYEPMEGAFPDFEAYCVLASEGRAQTVEVVYHPDDADLMWMLWHGNLIRMRVREISDTRRHWTSAELEAFKFDQSVVRAVNQTGRDNVRTETTARIASVVSKATKLTETVRGNVSERKKENFDKDSERANQQRLIKLGAQRMLDESKAVPTAGTGDSILDEEEDWLVKQLEAGSGS